MVVILTGETMVAVVVVAKVVLWAAAAIGMVEEFEV